MDGTIERAAGLIHGGSPFVERVQTLNLRHVVDVGAGDGAFVRGLRQQGYDGAIYSSEADPSHYAPLIRACIKDVRWFLLRQGAIGDHDGLVRDGVTNAPGAEANAASPIYVQRLDGLLPPSLAQRPFALRLSLVADRRAALDGLGALREHLAVLQVILRIEPSPGGATALAELHEQVISQTDLRDLHIETLPSPGVDGSTLLACTFWRELTQAERQPPAALPRPVIVTSMGGVARRYAADGSDVGQTWQAQCIDSWAAMDRPIYSVSEMAAPDPRLQQVPVATRPSILEILRQARRQAPDASLLLVNADIRLSRSFKALLADHEPDTLYFGSRTDVVLYDVRGRMAEKRGVYNGGLDYFLIPPRLLDLLESGDAFPESFRIGEPWWDYCLPVLAMDQGILVKRLSGNFDLVQHHLHDAAYSDALTTNNGVTYLLWVAEVAQRSGYPIADILGFPFDVNHIRRGDLRAAMQAIPRRF